MARAFQFSLIPIFLGIAAVYLYKSNFHEWTFWTVLGIVQIAMFILQRKQKSE